VALRARRRQYELRDQLQAREEAEAAEREARRLAEDAMHTREVFMATVAHDLKNPLGAVHGYTQLLERQIGALDIPAQQRLIQLVARIAQTTNRAISQIDELLDLASLHANQELLLNLAPVDLVPLARQMVDDYQQTTPRHSLRFESESDELVGVWDRTRITRVLANLLANAIKYSPAGGEIEVQVGREVRDGHSLAALSVEDDGIGIPAEDLPHIFDRFYRGRNTGRELPGTGLGLASARQIIEQHGGTIEVESRPGEGSRFTVHLPLVNGD
jgi:signal transduction histidine kinase